MAGEALPIEVVDDEREVWPWRTSLVDEPVVRVPAIAGDERTLRAVVLHHTGFAEFGSFTDRVARDLAFDASPHPTLARRVFGALEDRRIDEATRRHYPGARRDLDRLLADTLGAAAPEAPMDVRAAIVESLQLHSLGAGREEVLARVGAESVDVLGVVLDLATGVETAEDSRAAALAIVELLAVVATASGVSGPRPNTGPSQQDADDASTEPPPDERRSDADEPRPPSADMRQESGGPRAGRLADIEARAPDGQAPEQVPDAPARGDRGGRDVDDERGAQIFFYDEWDHLAQRHRPAWCRVVERRLDGDDRAFIADVRRRHSVLITRLRRQLAFMRPEGWVRVHHADEGDELDLDAVIEAVVDRRTGHAVDDRLHVRRDRAARDVATAFLVDLSASTSSPLPDEAAEAAAAAAAAAAEEEMVYRGGWIDPEPPPEIGRRILDVAKESVAVLGDALALLGDRHAVYGFSGESRHRVDVHVAKDFDDRWSPATWAAIAAMRSLKYTRMGPAVRHATARLAAQQARTKLLVVISDGYPQDVDYGPVRGDREYGLQDTARALHDAVDAGIAPYLLTIDPAGHEYLRRMLPASSYVVIEDVHSLPRELATLYGSVASRSSRGW